MRVLLLAPHPFYQDRGTPIAVRLLLRALSERGDTVDVVTFHEGEDVRLPGVTLHRIRALPGVRHIRPGFSVKKLICDVLLAAVAWRLCRANRYDVLHCVEESAFIGRWLERQFRVPYIYDMDSSMAQQLVDKMPWLGWLAGFFAKCERLAARDAAVVVPVCRSLVDLATSYQAGRVVMLSDIPLLDEPGEVRSGGGGERLDLSGLVLMYVGNLEPYQGIDLLLEAFQQAVHGTGAPDASLAIIGGAAVHIKQYRDKAAWLGVADRVHFLGGKPLRELPRWLAQADILVSPRIAGTNTPMKIYSYLQSGRPVLATRLETHTQVLTDEVSLLADPTPEAFGRGMAALLCDAGLRARLGESGARLARERYSYERFRATVDEIYSGLPAGSALPAGSVR